MSRLFKGLRLYIPISTNHRFGADTNKSDAFAELCVFNRCSDVFEASALWKVEFQIWNIRVGFSSK